MTKAILTNVDRSTKALKTAETALTKVNNDLGTSLENLVNEIAKTAVELEFETSKLEELKGAVALKERENKIELDLKIRENETKVVESILKSQKMTMISDDVLSALESKASVTEEEIQKRVNDEVARAVNEAKRDATDLINNIKSTHLIETANLKASNESLVSQIEMIKEQLEDSRATVKAERETRVKIAEAEASKQGVTVNTNK